ncbi:endonuclease V [Saccharopolyspora shandongensis]|uniref:endonuclease V n=1 Tax=Saccharopolyspora shandongensis TaxID=418495 RepID=UPI0033D78ED4
MCSVALMFSTTRPPWQNPLCSAKDDVLENYSDPTRAQIGRTDPFIGLNDLATLAISPAVRICAPSPSIGAGTTAMGRYAPPGEARGAWSPLRTEDEVVGRTWPGVKSVFDRACHLVLRLAPKYRLPETTRTADHLGRTV